MTSWVKPYRLCHDYGCLLTLMYDRMLLYREDDLRILLRIHYMILVFNYERNLVLFSATQLKQQLYWKWFETVG